MIIEIYKGLHKKSVGECSVKECFSYIEQARCNARKELVRTNAEHVLYAIHLYSKDDELERVKVFHNTALTDAELDSLIKQYPNAYFDVLHRGTHLKACKHLLLREQQREIRPINLKEANAFVNTHHRHHRGTVGCKFAVGLYEADRLIGVAICGRPVSRYLDTGRICEINRMCTLGDQNACSQLYGACARIAKEWGYEKIITYILQSESGNSLKASNFICEGVAGGTHWTGKRNRGQKIPHEMKTRWSRCLV